MSTEAKCERSARRGRIDRDRLRFVLSYFEERMFDDSESVGIVPERGDNGVNRIAQIGRRRKRDAIVTVSSRSRED